VQRTSMRVCVGGTLLALSAIARAGDAELARRADAGPRESYPGVDVEYRAITDGAGRRLRFIVTHPHGAPGRLPAVFVAGWLSCDTVEAPPGTRGAAQRVFQAIAQMPGTATARLEKAGVGDSQGDCARTDFVAELDGYRRAFQALRSTAFVNTDRIFIFGLSNGGGFAPLVPEGAPVRGYVVVGGWIKTWFEHMLEIERRRLALAGHPPSELNALMKDVEALYSQYLLEGKAPADIFARAPQLRSLWDGDPTQQYGRPISYYQQLQQLDLMQAWSQVGVPLLALHGEFDWIMSRQDLEIMVAVVNHNAPGSAEFVALPSAGHTFEHVASQQAAFTGPSLEFDESISRRIVSWIAQHQ